MAAPASGGPTRTYPSEAIEVHWEAGLCVVREDTRVALCRCGGSANKPFCDGTHRRIGFTTT